jgi:hypothetical protein
LAVLQPAARPRPEREDVVMKARRDSMIGATLAQAQRRHATHPSL